ncbi:MAG: polysaccharide deacetylase family protein [Candidatus Spechtbacteria bacterium]|nr:polysaccharide deacetylase family protein [Candidatus Spechtbacteria bacterium]
MKSLARTFMFGVLNLLFNSEVFSRGCAILMYHSVGENRVFFTVRPREFERQMEYLHKHDYSVISLSGLIERLQQGGRNLKKCVVLTFDDGYRDNYANAYPVLKKYGFPATIFVATGFIGQSMDNAYHEPLPMLSWGELKEMAGSGIIDIEPHTIHHKKLTELSSYEATAEIQESKKEIEEKLGKKCASFAYPHGSSSASVEDLARGAGFLAAVTTKEGIIGQKNWNPFALKRNSVDSTVNLVVFQAKLGFSNVLYHILKKYVSPS